MAGEEGAAPIGPGDVLEARDVTIRRAGVEVLSGVSTQLEPGRITAITGPNGAGKTSLLMALAGLLDPERGGGQGEVMLGGRNLAQLAPRERARAIGYLPQGGDIAWDVALETLVGLGRIAHDDGDCEPVDMAISALGLDHLRGRPVGRMSGGERARALLARVLAGRPRWILADEPLAALDLAHQLALAEHLRGCARDGTGVAIVLHDLTLAMNHADRVLVLDRGRLAADAPPDQALTPARIEAVWGVAASWIAAPHDPGPIAGDPDNAASRIAGTGSNKGGRRALIVHPPKGQKGGGALLSCKKERAGPDAAR